MLLQDKSTAVALGNEACWKNKRLIWAAINCNLVTFRNITIWINCKVTHELLDWHLGEITQAQVHFITTDFILQVQHFAVFTHSVVWCELWENTWHRHRDWLILKEFFVFKDLFQQFYSRYFSLADTRHTVTLTVYTPAHLIRNLKKKAALSFDSRHTEGLTGKCGKSWREISQTLCFWQLWLPLNENPRHWLSNSAEVLKRTAPPAGLEETGENITLPVWNSKGIYCIYVYICI